MKRRTGLDFVGGELIGWLWFAIGGSVHTSSGKRRGRGSYFDLRL